MTTRGEGVKAFKLVENPDSGLRAGRPDEIGTPDPQLEPQITSLEKCKID